MFRYYYESAGAVAAPAGTAGSIAFDAFTASTASFQSSSPGTLSHTPSGTPAGVAVFVIGAAGDEAEITGVTYGGSALSAVGTAESTATELGRVEGWFLGSGVPSGAQDVSVAFDTGGTNMIKVIGCYTVTAVGEPTVSSIDTDAPNTVQQNFSTTLDAAGASGIALLGFFSGEQDISEATASNITQDAYFDYTNQLALWGHSNVTTGSASYGWDTSSTDEGALLAIMVTDPGV